MPPYSLRCFFSHLLWPIFTSAGGSLSFIGFSASNGTSNMSLYKGTILLWVNPWFQLTGAAISSSRGAAHDSNAPFIAPQCYTFLMSPICASTLCLHNKLICSLSPHLFIVFIQSIASIEVCSPLTLLFPCAHRIESWMYITMCYTIADYVSKGEHSIPLIWHWIAKSQLVDSREVLWCKEERCNVQR